jgi:hypothetical protein
VLSLHSKHLIAQQNLYKRFSWKITDFELWHCCRKWAICTLMVQAPITNWKLAFMQNAKMAWSGSCCHVWAILILYGLNIFVLVWALLLYLSELYGVQRWIEISVHHKYLYGCNDENSDKSTKFYNETFSSATLTPQTDISAHLPVFTRADSCQTKQYKSFLWPSQLTLQVTVALASLWLQCQSLSQFILYFANITVRSKTGDCSLNQKSTQKC